MSPVIPTYLFGILCCLVIMWISKTGNRRNTKAK